ncbi:2-iminoacetate synthase ThiH [Nocardioides marinisabuli]|uniref:2-iminoacetate synthase ThiH n=1 Tax=Nocardioides marinisabuli TaxID=419476 RepID=A0A7Y9JQG9_9ACTN|nr:2-iminoacetate synthase ThiH [Nocardioides marinisabuli]
MAVVRRVRDVGLAGAGCVGVLTYSKKVSVPPTRLCRDRCDCCGFVTTPTQPAVQAPAGIQCGTGGSTELVPSPFVHRSAHARARSMRHGLIDSVQCSWVKPAPGPVRPGAQGGVNDLGGTLVEEAIARMADSTNRSDRAVLEATADLAGRPVRQRTTTRGADDPSGRSGSAS